MLDVGTGAGLPGIPLAVVNPELQFTLCDRMAKRIRFLRVVKSQLRLPNVELLEEDFGSRTERVRCFDTVLARAVAPATSLWPLLEPVLNDGGRMLVFSSTQLAVADVTQSGQDVDMAYHSRTERVVVPSLDRAHFLEILERR